MYDEDKLKETALGMLTEKRLIHTQGVRQTAKEMCVTFAGQEDADEKELSRKADMAVCFHDIYRGRSPEELDELIEKFGIPERYKGNANLAHGKIAASAMEHEFGIRDREVLDAVSYHTTGRAGMGLLEKIVFLADAIEPGRDYPLVSHLRELAKTDLDRACLESLEGTISFLNLQGLDKDQIDQDTVAARDWLADELAGK